MAQRSERIDLPSGSGSRVHLGGVAEVEHGGVEPRDATGLTGAADVPEVEHVGGGDILVFPGGAVGDDAVGAGRAEGIEQDAVESVLAGVGGGADGLSADEADAGGSGFCGEELGEEVAIDGDLAEDEGLRAVEVYLGGGIKGPGFGAGAVLKGLLGEAVPLGVAGGWLGLDAGANGALG